jgi:hypothetical protein
VSEGDASARDRHEALIRALARTADARRQHGRCADAARLYRQALELCDAALGPDAPERTAILNGLAAAEGACRRE